MKKKDKNLSGTGQSPSVAIITGASSGIGRAAALQLAAEGTHVVLVARRKEKLEEVAEEITARGGYALVVPADVSDSRQVEEAIQYVVEKEGHIDVLINNAGLGVYGSIQECSIEDYERQIQVNYLGAVYLTKAVLPVMQQANGGSIVIVSSICGKVLLPLYSGYCASKFALNAYTNILRNDIKDTGITVSLVCPGATESEFESTVTQRHSREHIKRIFPVITAEAVAGEIIGCINNPKREIVIPRIRKIHYYLQFFLPRVYEWYYWKFRS